MTGDLFKPTRAYLGRCTPQGLPIIRTTQSQRTRLGCPPFPVVTVAITTHREVVSIRRVIPQPNAGSLVPRPLNPAHLWDLPWSHPRVSPPLRRTQYQPSAASSLTIARKVSGRPCILSRRFRPAGRTDSKCFVYDGMCPPSGLGALSSPSSCSLTASAVRTRLAPSNLDPAMGTRPSGGVWRGSIIGCVRV